MKLAIAGQRFKVVSRNNQQACAKMLGQTIRITEITSNGGRWLSVAGNQ